MLVVDLMHEFELGVWKTVFIHLLRILDCHDEGLKHELDRRYAYLKVQGAAILMAHLRFREIPSFGCDGIRKTTSNRSELKKMTAHDYEDMLQVSLELLDFTLTDCIFSVQYQSSMVFSRNPIICVS